MKNDSQQEVNQAAAIKEEVKEKYAEIAKGNLDAIKTNSKSCSCESQVKVADLFPHYSNEDKTAIPEGADLGLGCGTPAAFADIEKGMTVLDLGSGTGIDCFVASRRVGEKGKVIGVDMTEEMIAKANENKRKVNAVNIDFRLGEIESLPVDSGTVDRVISNCVINLVPDKKKAFSEIFRVLKPGGKFTVSDIVTDGPVTDEERCDASLWAGCIAGALDQKDYLSVIDKAGFTGTRVISLKKHDYQLKSGTGIYSMTVAATKSGNLVR